MSRLTRALDAAVEVGVVSLLLFAPLPFGGVRPWAQATIASGVAVVAALWLARMLSAGEIAVPRSPVLAPGLLMAALLAAQVLLPGWSVSPHATGESARLFAAYLVLLVVLTGFLSTRARIVRLSWVVVVWGVVMAVLGLANHALGASKLLWFPKWPELNRLTTTFFNPNHQALFFEICLFVALGLILRPGRSRGRFSQPDDETSGRLAVTVLGAGAILVLGTALALTLSRGGLVSTLGGLAVLLALLAADRHRTRLPLLVLGGVLVFAAYGMWIGMETVTARVVGVAREPFTDLRWAVWNATLRMAVETPVFGVGLGAYQDGFTRFRPAGIPADRLVDYAHNDYLQLFAETGVIGLAALAWALCALLGFVLRRFFLRRDPFVKGMTLGMVCALGVVAIHSVLDFGLHRPANALLVVTLAAMAPAVVTWRVHRTGESVDLPAWRWVPSRGAQAWGSAAAVAGLALALVWMVPPGVADWKLQSALGSAGQADRARGAVSLQELAGARRELESAAWWDARNPRIQALLGEVLDEMVSRMWVAGVDADGRRLADPSVSARLRATEPLLAEAYAAYRQSIAQRPMGPEAHQGLGWLLGRLDGLRRALRGTSTVFTDPVLAGALGADGDLVAQGLAEVTRGAQLDPASALRQRNLALYALTFPMDVATSRRVAADAYRRVLTIEPQLLGRVIDDLVARRVDQELLLDSVPRVATMRLAMARQLAQRGQWPGSSAAFEDAIRLAAALPQEVEVRLAYGQELLRRKDAERALYQARQALVSARSNPDVFVLLGEIYEGLGQYTEAESAFNSAVAVVGEGPSRRSSGYRARLASFLARRGQGDRAVALWRQVLKTTPNDPWLRLELAYTLEARGDGTGALIEYQAAASLGSGDFQLQWDVARALAHAGHVRESIAAYERATTLWPHMTEPRWEFAELLVRAGSLDRAAEQYRRVLVSRPDHEGARRGLANLPVSVTSGRAEAGGASR